MSYIFSLGPPPFPTPIPPRPPPSDLAVKDLTEDTSSTHRENVQCQWKRMISLEEVEGNVFNFNVNGGNESFCRCGFFFLRIVYNLEGLRRFLDAGASIYPSLTQTLPNS